MTQEKADLINRLMEIEDRIEELWEFHPDNPDAIDVVDEFNKLQRDASGIEDYLQTLWTPEDDEDIM
jgi:hypothetical protein